MDRNSYALSLEVCRDLVGGFIFLAQYSRAMTEQQRQALSTQLSVEAKILWGKEQQLKAQSIYGKIGFHERSKINIFVF